MGDIIGPSSIVGRIFDVLNSPLCSTKGCENPGMRSRGCNICQANLTSCLQHLIETFQSCVAVLGAEAVLEQRKAEISILLAEINLTALVRTASSLNNGLSCTVTPGATSMMGCCNYHLQILFPDSGQRWLVRVPRPSLANLHKQIDVEYQYASEFATLQFLARTTIPAPRAFDFNVASNASNEVEVTYLIMEFLEGVPFNPHQASLEEKKKVYDGVAEILVELSKHPLPSICSLVPGGPNYRETYPVVGKIASLRSKVMRPFGPFSTAGSFYTTVVETHLRLIEEGKLYPEFSVEAYLTYAIVRDNISKLYSQKVQSRAPLAAEAKRPKGTDGSNVEPEGFYLTHIDPKGDHILLSPTGHIAGIIDWQGARFTPFSEAFGPSLLTCDLHAMYFGDSGLTSDDRLLAASLFERGAPQLANVMVQDERARRLHFGLGLARTEQEIWDLVRGILKAFDVYEGEDFEIWRETAIERYKGDGKLIGMLEKRAGICLLAQR